MNVSLFEITVTATSLFMSGIVLGWLVFRLITGRSAFSEENYNKMNSELIAAKTRLGEKEKDIEQLNSFLATERGNSTRLEKEVSSRETEIINLNLSLEDKRNELEELNERFNEEFKNIANQILAHNSSEFSKNTVETLKNVLSPLKEQIDKFGNKIEETRINQVQEATSLKEQINQLTSLNQLMSAEAQNLTNALKGESKTRGTWGEMILEKILENSGLIKGEHFLAQTQYRDEEENRLRPDIIVNLPEKKHLIIDSKVSLVDYERYCNEEVPETRAALIKSHIASVKNHIMELSSKEYQKALGINPPEIILMFVPIETALLAALENDKELFVFAYNRNIALISPTTLIPTLKIIHTIWRQENQNKNAIAIADTGGKLYDKLVGFLNDLQDVGKSIDKAKNSYESAFKKVSTGKGNILNMAERMKEMGAKASKNIPAEIGYDEE